MNTFLLLLIFGIIITMYIFDLFVGLRNARYEAEPPKEVADVYDQEAYQKWLGYSKDRYRFSLVAKGISLVLTLTLLALSIPDNIVFSFKGFDELAQGFTKSAGLQVMIFFGFYYVLSTLIRLPLKYYSTFVIEEKYGFNKTTKKLFFVDQLKSFVLMGILLGALIYGLASLASTELFNLTNPLFFIVTYLIMIILLFVIQIIYVPVLVPIFNKLSPLEDGELKDMIVAFAEKQGYQIGSIRVLDQSRRSTKLNAFFAGLGKAKHIVLFDTLIEKSTNEEIVAVLAHEIGHGDLKHIPRNFIASFASLAVMVAMAFFVLNASSLGEAFAYEGALPLGFGIIIFMNLYGPIAEIIGVTDMMRSRRFEYEADRYAATNFKKEPMITALKLLAKENMADLSPEPLYEFIHYSHPPIYKRIRAINQL
jgi:STE24 endopeptidase